MNAGLLDARDDPSFRWVSVAHGWVTFELEGSSGRYRCTVGDSNDVFALVVSSADRIALGDRSAAVSFDHEPAEIRLTLKREGDGIRATVAVFQEWGASSGGLVRWEGLWGDHRHYSNAILTATDLFVRDLGLNAFRDGWPTYPLPSERIETLRVHVAPGG